MWTRNLTQAADDVSSAARAVEKLAGRLEDDLPGTRDTVVIAGVAVAVLAALALGVALVALARTGGDQ